MSCVVHVAIHESQSPGAVREDLLESLRARRINHKFHYDSFKQARKWLALHRTYSPSRTDPDCAGVYDRSFISAATRIDSATAHVIGLGCGGGQKDTRLLRLLRERGKEARYSPCDVSVAMVLVARETAREVIGEETCFPTVCDLAKASNLSQLFDPHTPPHGSRLVTFFGMIPNFEPQLILPKLAALVRSGDLLLFSANLAPGSDYPAGVRRILPLYDNELTRDWLMTFLTDLGVERADGELRFGIDSDDAGGELLRITATFHFGRAREIRVDGERFEFRAGDAIRLFFSYRHTPEHVRVLLAGHGLEVLDQWVAHSEEEGVFLCRRGQ